MRIWTLCTVISMLALASLAAQAYRPVFKDADGAVRTTKTTFTIKGTMDGADISAPFTATSTLVEEEKVTAINAGVATLARQLKEGSTSVSTTMPGDDAPQVIQQAMPSYTITYDRTPLGKVSNVKIAGDLAKEISNSSDSLTTQTLTSGEGLEFPDRELNVGDTWTGTQALAMGNGAKADLTVHYTLAGTQKVNGKTYLMVAYDVTMKVPDLKVKSPLGEIPMSMEVTGKATMLFDLQAGEIFRDTFSLTNTTTINVPGGDVGTATMKSTIDGTTNKVAQ